MTQEQQQAGDGNQPEDSAPTIIGPTAEVAAGVGGVAVGGDVIGSVIVVGDFDPDSNKAAEQYQEYVLSLIRRYDKQAFRRKLTHNGLQLTIFIGAAAATVLVAFSKIIPGILTGIVTVATAIANYYKFGEHSRYLESVAEDLALEYNKFLTRRGIYKDITLPEALPLFMDRVESLILEQRQRAAALEQVKEADK